MKLKWIPGILLSKRSGCARNSNFIVLGSHLLNEPSLGYALEFCTLKREMPILHFFISRLDSGKHYYKKLNRDGHPPW